LLDAEDRLICDIGGINCSAGCLKVTAKMVGANLGHARPRCVC
jgi:xylose isomerase